MQSLRKILGWVFGISSMLCIWGEYFVVLATIQTLRNRRFTSWDFKTWLIVLVINAIVPVFVTIFGVTWWTSWKEKISARGWGITASLIFVLISVYVFLQTSKPIWWVPEVELAIGMIGLIAFARRYETKPKTNASESQVKPS